MLKFVRDFFLYPFTSAAKKSNRFRQFLQFVGKDYPAYFWAKPSVRRVIVLPFLLVRIIVSGSEK